MAELDPRFVKQGFWTNHAQGPTMGRTITVDTRTGTIIVALLAVLSSLATAHLWHLLAFLFHQLRADEGYADGLFRQQQALLRTLPPPSSIMADHVKLWWSWRRRADRALARLLPQTSLAALLNVGTIAASVFSSYVLTSGNIEILVKTHHCGLMIVGPPDAAEMFRNYTTAVSYASETWRDQCYSQRTPAAACYTFPQPRIKVQRQEAACPFASSVCRKNTPGLRLDSGLLDIGHTFGLNMRSKDRLLYQKVTTCGVLSLENRTSIVRPDKYPTGRMTLPGEEIMLLHYGEFPGWWPNDTTVTQTKSLSSSNLTTAYTLSGMNYYSSPYMRPFSSFTPIPELNHTDADVMLNTIYSNALKYLRPVDDPIFSAHQPLAKVVQIGNVTTYGSDFPVGVIGCTLQHRFCLPGPKDQPKCTNLSYVPGTPAEVNLSPLSDVQVAILQQLVNASHIFDLSEAGTVNAETIGTHNGYSPGLPDDQWMTEVMEWDSFYWASMQILMADYAIGSSLRLSSPTSYIPGPRNEGERQFCNMQKMRKDGGFVNINVFGLALIIAFSCFLTLVDIFLLRVLVFLSRFRRALAPRIDQWIQDGVLQLQRRAYEARGEGTWTSLEEEIPVTKKGEKLSVLPVSSEGIIRRQETFASIPATLTDSKFEESYGSEKGDR